MFQMLKLIFFFVLFLSWYFRFLLLHYYMYFLALFDGFYFLKHLLFAFLR